MKTAEITDRYLVDTRLRLRTSVEHSADGAATIYKLTQIPTLDGGPLLITTIYLDQNEYEVFETIPAATLRKRV